jgi:predicted dehydrogenase
VKVKKKYNVAIIGCGGIGFRYGENYSATGAFSHFDALMDSDRFEIVSIAEKNEKICHNIHHTFNLPVYRDYLDLFDHYKIDVVVIATPRNTHGGILKDIIRFNPDLVFCEKPLGSNSIEVREVVDLYREKKIPLATNYTRRYILEYEKIRQVINSREMGDIKSITVYYSRGFLNNASHFLDLILWWVGFPDSICITGSKPGIEIDDPTLSFYLKYNSGLDINFIGFESNTTTLLEMDLFFTDGRINIDTLGYIKTYKVKQHEVFEAFKAFYPMQEDQIDLSLALPGAFDNLFKFLEGNEPLKSPAVNSIDIHKLMEQIHRRLN